MKTGLAFILTSVVLRFFQTAFLNFVSSGSMLPGIEYRNINNIVINPIAYGVKVPLSDYKFFKQDPSRGDVMLFMEGNGSSQKTIKRVIGLPGDRIDYIDGILYVNKKALTEEINFDLTAFYNTKNLHSLEEEGGTVTIRKESIDGKSYYVQDVEKLPYSGNFYGFTVGQSEYFVMGDNRRNSKDSRDIGCIREYQILGKAVYFRKR